MKGRQGTTEERMRLILSDKLAQDLEDIKDDSRLEEDLNADSLDLVEIIMETEDEFGLEITDEEAEHVKTVRQAIDLAVLKVTQKEAAK